MDDAPPKPPRRKRAKAPPAAASSSSEDYAASPPARKQPQRRMRAKPKAGKRRGRGGSGSESSHGGGGGSVPVRASLLRGAAAAAAAAAPAPAPVPVPVPVAVPVAVAVAAQLLYGCLDKARLALTEAATIYTAANTTLTKLITDLRRAQDSLSEDGRTDDGWNYERPIECASDGRCALRAMMVSILVFICRSEGVIKHHGNFDHSRYSTDQTPHSRAVLRLLRLRAVVAVLEAIRRAVSDGDQRGAISWIERMTSPEKLQCGRDTGATGAATAADVVEWTQFFLLDDTAKVKTKIDSDPLLIWGAAEVLDIGVAVESPRIQNRKTSFDREILRSGAHDLPVVLRQKGGRHYDAVANQLVWGGRPRSCNSAA